MFSCHASLASYCLWQFLWMSLPFRILTLLKIIDQLCYRMSLSLGFLMFFMVEKKLCIFARRTRRMVVCPSQRTISGDSWCPFMMSMCFITGNVDLGHLVIALPAALHYKVTVFPFISIIWETLWNYRSLFLSNFHSLTLASIGGLCLQQLLLWHLPNTDFHPFFFLIY